MQGGPLPMEDNDRSGGVLSWRHQFFLWVGVATAALVVLGAILAWEYKINQRRWALFFPAKPAQGSEIFRAKGCVKCHGQASNATSQAAGLRGRPSLSSPSHLVSSMWNHAPLMWQAFQERNLEYPAFSYEEMAQLLPYLYMSGYSDPEGNAANGATLFHSKHCAHCHSDGSKHGPEVSRLSGADTALAWTQVLWNHASAMEARMKEAGIAWPKFQANELRDLFAYVRQASGRAQEVAVPAADLDRGWELFQRKSCLECHPVEAEKGRKLPATFSQFGEAMLNHFPEMQRAMKTRGAAPPTFRDHEMSDLASFLYSLHYLEPTGSPQVGKSVFAWRGCSRCHGTRAEGGDFGPQLRSTGRHYTAVRLAAEFWQHGGDMYRKNQSLERDWPALNHADVGHLLAFLNTPVD
jgi:mono/diheme cytochrome c family protein